MLWTVRLGSMGSLPSHISDAGGFIPTTDLSGHPLPVVDGDLCIWQVGDLFAIDLVSGELRWRYKLKAKNPQLKNAFARPIVADGVVYAVGAKKLVGLNLADGSERWVAKLPNAPLPQLELIDDLLVVRLGGTFSTGKKIVQQKPFGVAVVDREGGGVRWTWKRGSGLTH
jgi:outer membrane protein assembly factor BamB